MMGAIGIGDSSDVIRNGKYGDSAQNIEFRRTIKAVVKWVLDNNTTVTIGDLPITKDGPSNVNDSVEAPEIDKALKNALSQGEAYEFMNFMATAKPGSVFTTKKGVKITFGTAEPKKEETPQKNAPDKNPSATGKALDTLLGWALGIRTADASTLTDKEKAKIVEGGITRAEAKKLGISDALFDLMSSNMDPTGKADGVINVADAAKAVETVLIYAKTYGLDQKKAYELYQNAKSFKIEDLTAVQNAKAAVISGMGITNASTYQQVLDKVKDPACKEALKAFFELELRADLTKKMDPNHYEMICARISAMPLISKLDKDLQTRFFAVKTPLTLYASTELTAEKILEYLGVTVKVKKKDTPVDKPQPKPKTTSKELDTE